MALRPWLEGGSVRMNMFIKSTPKLFPVRAPGQMDYQSLEFNYLVISLVLLLVLFSCLESPIMIDL